MSTSYREFSTDLTDLKSLFKDTVSMAKEYKKNKGAAAGAMVGIKESGTIGETGHSWKRIVSLLT
jgi:hypothetical protein